MPEPWISGQQVLQRIADDVLSGKDVGTLPPKYLRAAEQAARIATAQIRSILKLRGWTATQVEGWDDRVAYATDLATFLAAPRCVGIGDYNLDALKELDCREYLRESPELSVGGAPQAPSPDAAVGGAAAGTLDAAAAAFDGFDAGTFG